MLKMFSEIIGTNIYLFQEHALAGQVNEILVSPQDGSILGLFLFDPVVKRERIIPTSEIISFSAKGILVKGYDSLTDVEDLIKVKEVLDQKNKIIKSPVYTKSGKRVGKVSEATINIKNFSLDRLYVTPVFRIKYLAKDLIIPSSKIEAILPKKIIIADGFIKNKAAKPLLATIATSETS